MGKLAIWVSLGVVVVLFAHGRAGAETTKEAFVRGAESGSEYTYKYKKLPSMGYIECAFAHPSFDDEGIRWCMLRARELMHRQFLPLIITEDGE
jgi:hypothetical protein